MLSPLKARKRKTTITIAIVGRAITLERESSQAKKNKSNREKSNIAIIIITKIINSIVS